MNIPKFWDTIPKLSSTAAKRPLEKFRAAVVIINNHYQH